MLLGNQNWRLHLLGVTAALGAGLTVVTARLVERQGFGETRKAFRLRARRPGVSGLAPAVGMALLLLFWVVYGQLPREERFFAAQMSVYYALVGLLTLVCLLLSCRKGRRWALAPTAVLLAGGLALPKLATRFVWLEVSQKVMVDHGVVSDIYSRFYGLSAPMVGAASAGIVLCAALAVIRVEWGEAGEPLGHGQRP